jgi:DMSO/TMAO reductase YedYZ molybdopterin-dependent catalytic subunit
MARVRTAVLFNPELAGTQLAPQGYPVRLLVPGWEGPYSVKWLRQIKVVDQPYMAWDEAMGASASSTIYRKQSLSMLVDHIVQFQIQKVGDVLVGH